MERLDLLQTLEGHDERVWCVAWSPDGTALASCSADRTVRLWAPLRSQAPSGGGGADGTAAAGTTAPDGVGTAAAAAAAAAGQAAGERKYGCVAVLEDSHTKTVRTVSWSNDGRHLATAGFDGITAIWERQGGVWESVATLEGHENEVKCAAWSPSGGVLATCGRDKAVWLWEHLPGNEFECLDVKPAHSADVKAVAWHPGGELLASCSYDDSVKLWAAAGGDEWECAQTLAGPSGHTSTVWSVAFSPDGGLMASCSGDNTVRIWECRFEGTQPAFRLSAVISGYHDRTIYSCAWSADGRLATGDASNAIRVFERAGPGAGGDSGGGDGSGSSWEQVCCVPKAHDADVNSVAWHPSDATLLASAGDDEAVRLWRLQRRGARGGGGAAVGAAQAV